MGKIFTEQDYKEAEDFLKKMAKCVDNDLRGIKKMELQLQLFQTMTLINIMKILFELKNK